MGDQLHAGRSRPDQGGRRAPIEFEKGSQIAEFTAPHSIWEVSLKYRPPLRLQAPLKGLFGAKQTPCFKSVPALEPVRADRDADCSGPSFMDPGVIPLASCG